MYEGVLCSFMFLFHLNEGIPSTTIAHTGHCPRGSVDKISERSLWCSAPGRPSMGHTGIGKAAGVHTMGPTGVCLRNKGEGREPVQKASGSKMKWTRPLESPHSSQGCGSGGEHLCSMYNAQGSSSSTTKSPHPHAVKQNKASTRRGARPSPTLITKGLAHTL